MKKLKICLCMMSALVMLGGCGGQIPDMTDEQREAISEYAVGLLLKYDTSQSDRLVDLSLLDEEEPEATEAPVATPEPTLAPEEDLGAAGIDATEGTPTIPVGGELAEDAYDEVGETLLLPEHISLQYCDYQVVSTYTDPEDAELTLDAKEGYSFLVVRFNLLNSGSDTQAVDMLQANVKHTVIMEETSVNAMVTLLSNDMITYMGTLAADESREVVMLAEVEDNVLQGAENISVEFMRDDLISRIVVK